MTFLAGRSLRAQNAFKNCSETVPYSRKLNFWDISSSSDSRPWRNKNRLKKLLCRSWNFAISLLVQTLDTHATWIVVICFSEMEALMHLAKKLFNAQNVPSITQLAIKSRDTCMLWAYSILSCSFFIRSLTYSKNIKFSFHKWIQNNSSSKFSYYQATRKINC